MAEYFTKRGYVINMIDIRGFGFSGGDRVNEPTKKILSDIETLLRNCCERDLKTFIIAHDLGATLLNALLQENTQLPISGVINVAPLMSFVGSRGNLTYQRVLLKLSPPIFNNILVHNMINPTALTKDPYAIKTKI
jgi:acylglycerol lipase